MFADWRAASIFSTVTAMPLFLRVCLLLTMTIYSARGVEIDPHEAPLLKVTFPLDNNTEEAGPHDVITYYLYESGIGYSVRKVWNGSIGSHRNRETFWLEPPLIDAVIDTAKTCRTLSDIPPRNQQIILEGTAIPKTIVSSWLDRETPTLKLLYFMSRGIREDLKEHFSKMEAFPK